MAIGDLERVPNCTDLYYLDTGMYDTEAYGSVYIVDADRPAVVDTGIGTNREFLFDALDEVGIGEEDLEYILPTHIHLDHAGGAGFLADRYPNATVMTHDIGVPHLVDPSRLVAGTKAAVDDQWQFYVDPKPVPEDRIEGLEGGETIDLGDRELAVVHAPGHAPHQVMFHDTGDDVLFTGDAAGIWIPSERKVRQTTPPSQFDLEQCLDDASTIVDRDPDVLCFGHFGPLDFGEELMDGYKRTLVEWVEAVRQKRDELEDDDAVIEYFQNHTDMVETWGEQKARDEERLNVKGVLGYLDYREEE
ncbi:MBL fold metallo-hydrolase [Halogranum rubrum]|uniref:Zn-dependent hydrolase, glyoxylase n=1 Tax=Halogranum salarium B-1 TaxID=1210908 RepID=J2ZC82_9EURY|nr:MBL fold metallo-hydrolase [Halogranum salarium]EJN58285.1 zn-dependent hydrolase, glyoxylase [Halogranum salarium B-1]